MQEVVCTFSEWFMSSFSETIMETIILLKTKQDDLLETKVRCLIHYIKETNTQEKRETLSSMSKDINYRRAK